MNIKHKPNQGIHLAKNQHGTLPLDPNAGFYCVSFPAVDVEMSSVMFCSSNLSTRCPNSFHFSQLTKSPLWQAHKAALKPIKCFSCPLPSYDPSPKAPHCCALLGGMGKRVAWETNMPKPLIPSSNYYYSIPSSHLCLLMTLEISCLLTNYSLIQVILRSALAISYSSIMLRLLHAARISKVFSGAHPKAKGWLAESKVEQPSGGCEVLSATGNTSRRHLMQPRLAAINPRQSG